MASPSPAILISHEEQREWEQDAVDDVRCRAPCGLAEARQPHGLDLREFGPGFDWLGLHDSLGVLDPHTAEVWSSATALMRLERND